MDEEIRPNRYTDVGKKACFFMSKYVAEHAGEKFCGELKKYHNSPHTRTYDQWELTSVKSCFSGKEYDTFKVDKEEVFLGDCREDLVGRETRLADDFFKEYDEYPYEDDSTGARTPRFQRYLLERGFKDA